MIKRRFYKLEHGDRDAPSESSSSSDSELEAEATDDSEEEEDDGIAEVREKVESGLSSSGYESEDSSAHEVNLDSSGLPMSDDDVEPERDGLRHIESGSSGQGDINSVGLEPKAVVEKDEDQLDLPDCVVKRKSVFKCRLCPRIVCLSEETLKAHLKSKRHSRSEKLFKDGRLKHMLDVDGKIEDRESEEDLPPPVASVPNSGMSGRKKRGLRGQKRSKKKSDRHSSGKGREATNTQAKKRLKDDD